MTQKSKRRPGGGGATAVESSSSPENSPPNSTEQAVCLNPLPALLEKFDALLGGSWPGELRQLMDAKQPKPLAIGIRGDIVAAAGMGEKAAERRLGVLLRKWTSSARYLNALGVYGAQRHALDGSTAPASPEHIADARQRLEERRQRWAKEAGARASPATGNAARPVLRLRTP
jgi:hypothetical protein